MKVFSLGYQNLNIENYVQTLLSAGVGLVLDVREIAWSNNRQFAKYNLIKTLPEAGLSYAHLRECGNPSANRKTAPSVKQCLERYEIYLRENPKCLESLLSLTNKAFEKGKPACLTCYEYDPKDCHRSILINALKELVPALEVIHLQPELKTKKAAAHSIS